MMTEWLQSPVGWWGALLWCVVFLVAIRLVAWLTE
jgi:hypothetical protein